MNRYKIAYSLGITEGYKEVSGEYYKIHENGVLQVLDKNDNCILAFASTTWLFIEDVTIIEEVKSFLGRT